MLTEVKGHLLMVIFHVPKVMAHLVYLAANIFSNFDNDFNHAYQGFLILSLNWHGTVLDSKVLFLAPFVN